MPFTATVLAVCTSPGGLPKTPRESGVLAGPEGLEGDAQRNRKVHGGPDQAVCVFLDEDYRGLAAEGRRLPGPGAMGENVTLGGLSSSEARIGDVWAGQEVELEITALRLPCRNLEVYGKEFPDLVLRTGRSGFYCRVLRPGRLRPGEDLERTREGTVPLATAFFARTGLRPGGSTGNADAGSDPDRGPKAEGHTPEPMTEGRTPDPVPVTDRDRRAAIALLLAEPALSARWRERLEEIRAATPP
jgi:MOSC domain-containing protein YiiM